MPKITAATTMGVRTKVIVALLVAGAFLCGLLVFFNHKSPPTITVTVRITVAPPGQVDFVTARANSAQFKYLVGKRSGIKPALAQKLASQSVPRSALLEARLGALTPEEGHRYVAAFLPTLQEVCGEQVQLVFTTNSIQ